METENQNLNPQEMENENQPTPAEPQAKPVEAGEGQAESTAPAETTELHPAAPASEQPVKEEKPKKKGLKYLLFTVAVLGLGALAYFGYTNPQLFRAEITETTVPAGAAQIYISNYDTSATDTGKIAVRIKTDATMTDINSVSFKLTYEPDVLTFNTDANQFFDTDTLFQSADIKDVNTSVPGEVFVSLFAADPITAPYVLPTSADGDCGDGTINNNDVFPNEQCDDGNTASLDGCDDSCQLEEDPILFKLALDINGTQGQTVDLGIENFEVVEKEDIGLLPFKVSTYFTSMDAGDITLVSQDQLRVLNAEALDENHLLVRFSDLLQSQGSYLISEDDVCLPSGGGGTGLLVIDVESGVARGYDTSTALLDLSGITPLTPGSEYFLCAYSGQQGNTQGGLDSDYKQAIFHAYGQSAEGLNNFRLESAQSTDYDKIRVTFSDPLEESSVNAAGFDVTVGVGGGAVPVIEGGAECVVSECADGVVELTVNYDLLTSETYVIEVNNDVADVKAIRRASDNAVVGLNRITTAGYKNGPQLVSAEFTNATTLVVTFSENIQSAGTEYGRIVETGTEISLLTSNNSNTTPSNNQLTITGFTDHSAEKNYTFVGDPALHHSEIPALAVDPSYNRITFWGDGSTFGPNAIGEAEITRGNVVEVTPAQGGSVNFNTVDSGEVEVFYYTSYTNKHLPPISVDDVSVTEEGKLKVVVTPGFDPDLTYFIKIGVSPNLGVDTFTLKDDFIITGAQATENDKVLVSFSENVDQATVAADKFSVKNLTNPLNLVTVDSATVQAGFTQVLLDLDTNMNAGDVYAVTAIASSNVGGNNILGVDSFFGSKILTKYVAAFAGYQTLPDLSSVKLNSIDVNSSTELVLHFSGALDSNTVNAVNIDIKPITGSELTVTNTEMIDTQTARLTTVTQASDVNYFVIMDGVKDAGGSLLGNAKVLNFFGYIIPGISVANVTPGSVTNETDKVVVALGGNLDLVTEARFDPLDPLNLIQITGPRTSGALSITVPAGLNPDVYDLVLLNAAGETTTVSGAVVVSLADQPMRIISEQSLSIPNRVPPDGVTEITLWVLVEDPRDLNNIDSVTVDLEQIGGNRAQEMTKDTGVQPQFRQYYTYATTVDATTATQADPYHLAVQVRKRDEVANGTIDVYVTHDVLQSQAPTFDQVYANPSTIAPDGVTEATITAVISDPDGADTIGTVVANLGPLGVGFVILNPLNAPGQANELTTNWYASDPFTLPETTQDGTHTIDITVSDATGESATYQLSINVSSALTGPSIDGSRSYVAPVSMVARNGAPFTLHVMVTDPNGVDDVDTVTAYAETLGITPVALLRDPGASGSSKTALYSSGPIVAPVTAPFGAHQIEIVATDSTGGSGNTIIQIEVTYGDMIGDSPLIFDNKAYTTPQIAVNDGQTGITLYAFVRDDDDDLDSVVVNLSGVGQLGPETPPDFGAAPAAPAGQATCPTGSNTIVCMNPSFKEGMDGQWFVLPGVTISSLTPASAQPYQVEVIATDMTGKIGRGSLPISVRDSEGFVDDQNPPEIVAVVSVGEGTVEVAFNEEISALSISSNGGEFTITESTDVNEELNVISAAINAAGDIVTLTTANQVAGKNYVLTGDSDITDTAGVKLVAGKKIDFTGFEESAKKPLIEYASATDTETIEIEFREDIRPSSVKTGVDRDFDISVFESDNTSNVLVIHEVHFAGGGNILQVTTDRHSPNTRYRIQVENIASAAGNALLSPISQTFKAINASAVQQVQTGNAADLNGDGKVDFIDFTIFSSVYGQAFGGPAALPTVPEVPGIPFSPTPDALIPTTSSVGG